MSASEELVVVAGAGPVGCLTALLMLLEEEEDNPRRRVIVVEKRPDPRTHTSASSSSTLQLKSINLALSDRGRAALRRVGLEQAVLADAVEMTGRLVHLNRGAKDIYQQYDDVDGTRSIYSVSRETVTNVLRARLFAMPHRCEFVFDDRVVKFHQDKHHTTLVRLASGREITCAALFGCDGSYSSVREAMSRVCRLDFHREYIEMGYSELVVRAGCALRVNVLHIWPKEEEHGMMMIALPNADGTFTATLFAPFDTLFRLQQQGGEAFALFLAHHFPECMSFLNGGSTRCRAHPLFTSTVKPWHAGSAVLLGDAAHAQVPFFGQGMNAGLEDALVLYETYQSKKEEEEKDWESILREFDGKRSPCGKAITELSLENYVEMHTSTSQWWFRVSRRVQGLVSHVLPRTLARLPLYYQVAFTRRPYCEILAEKRSAPPLSSLVVAAVALAAAAAALAAVGGATLTTRGR